MSRDLPSLNAVRMFEVAARHLNFTRAAEQLYVTQGAVSRQVKHLEQDLGQLLFRRDGPKLELTNAGVSFYRATEEALAIIRRSTLEMKRLSAKPMLTLSILPSLAAKWLLPRITSFQHDNNDIDLRLATSYDAVDFNQRPDIDIAIRFGSGDWPNLYSKRLINEQVFPVCSPTFLANAKKLSRPEDIAKQPLIFASGEYDQWSDWFEAAGVLAPAHQDGPIYNDALLLIQSAIEGQGVTLGRSLLVDDELRSGRLVRLFDISVACANSYFFVCPDGREQEANIASLMQWLVEEARMSEVAYMDR